MEETNHQTNGVVNKRKMKPSHLIVPSIKMQRLDPLLSSPYVAIPDSSDSPYTTEITLNDEFSLDIEEEGKREEEGEEAVEPLLLFEEKVHENICNFRRFSGRPKKQTDFFAHQVSEHSSYNVPHPNKPTPSRKRKSNQAINRALRFKNTNNNNSNNTGGVVTSSHLDPLQQQNEISNLVAKEQLLNSGPPDQSTGGLTDTPLSSTTNGNASLVYPESSLPPAIFPPIECSYPIGTLVWGKLPGYEWWPGTVISYDKKDPTTPNGSSSNIERNEEEEEEDGKKGDTKVPWVKWFGDNQLSQLAVHKLHPFSNFIKHLSHNKLKGLYKKAIFSALKEAAKRSSKELGLKSEDRKSSWIFHSNLFPSFVKDRPLVNVNEEETPLKVTANDNSIAEVIHDHSYDNIPTTVTAAIQKEDTELSNDDDSPMYSPDSSTVPLVTMTSITTTTEDILFTPLSSETTRQRIKAGQVQLSSSEKDLLEWALNGFLPSGPVGFNPRPEDVVEIKVVPVLSEGSNGGDTLQQQQQIVARQSFTNRNNATIEKKEEPQLMMVHLKNKAQFELVHSGQLNIEDICIACGGSSVVAQHPLFHGGLCKNCKETFMECAYLFDEDGSQMYCTVCSAGNQVFMCDTPNCSKVFCSNCIEKLCGPEERMRVQEATNWTCYMCSEVGVVRILRRRDDWDKKLHDLFLTDNEETEYEPFKYFPPIAAEERKPLRVLGLFDGVGTGYLVLKELGFQVEAYIASEIDPDAIKVSLVQHPDIIHLGAIERLTEEEVRQLGPFDLVFGGSPCNDLSIVNPARKGIYDGTGRLFFEFFRVLSYARPHPSEERPFFWLYENVVSMRAPDKKIISRFLQCNPVVVDAREISAAHRARYFWGNIPGMNRPTVPLPGDRLTLQECLEPNCFRQAQFDKLRTITTKMNSIKQTKMAIFPVKVTDNGLFSEKEGAGEEEGDVLWCTEMERLFGFPTHYTDVANLGRCGRQKLLGKAWSVPVVRHLLSPLKDYFQSNTTRIPSSTIIKPSPPLTADSLSPLPSNSDTHQDTIPHNT